MCCDDLKIRSGLVWRILLPRLRENLVTWVFVDCSWTVAGWIVIYVTTGRQCRRMGIIYWRLWFNFD